MTKKKPTSVTPRQPVLWRWQHIVPLVAVSLAFLSTLYVAYAQKEKRRLDFWVTSQNVLANLTDRSDAGLQLLFEGEPIDNATLLALRIKNSGNRDLYWSDADPASVLNPRFRIEFSEDTRILQVDVRDVTKNQEVRVRELHRPHPNHVEFAAELFNVGATVELDFVVANYSGSDVACVGQGVGVTARKLLPDGTVDVPWWHMIIALVFVIAATTVVGKLVGRKYPGDPAFFITMFAFFAMVFGLGWLLDRVYLWF